MMSSNTASNDAALMAPPSAPSGQRLWNRAVTVASILVALFTLDRISVLLGHYWLMESLDLQSVFWTNFSTGATLYVVALVGFAAAAWAPAFAHPLRSRGWIMAPGFLLATVAAYMLALHYADFLFGTQAISFGEDDPVFGHDLGFYVFDLPYLWVIWSFTLGAALVFLGSAIACAFAVRERNEPAPHLSQLSAFLGSIATWPVRLGVVLVGLTGAVGVWLGRYDAVVWDNADSSVHAGADVLDVTGLFSNLNYINVTTLVIIGITIAIVLLLTQLARAAQAEADDAPSHSGVRWGLAAALLVGLLTLDFAFKAGVELRDMVAVKPNEPVVQLPYIARHLEATRAAYGLEDIEAIDFMPNGQDAPLPSVEELLASTTVRNAPLWPGFQSYLERLLDPQHAERIVQTGGDAMIYGPTLDIFQQEQKLRAYYRFLSVDNVRYYLGGEKRMLVSAVRELPLFEPVPWLNYWGQRYVLFTHGFGVAMAYAGEVTEEGTPAFVSFDIPGKVTDEVLALDNERVYYGEGAETMAFSNVDQMKELDYPTEQDRAELLLPEDVRTGIYLDSFLKRLVLGWRSGRLSEFLFSDLITDRTRVHYIRTPLDRLEAVAPFLYFDTNPYAVVADGQLTWIVNALSTTDRYPYSMRSELGDKSDERTPFPRPTRWVNYVEDSVKATVNADDGRVQFYQISDQPVIKTWAAVYPELFASVQAMPEGVRSQLTYSVQLFHLQFDDLYIYYHMDDPMYFFNLEDMWDDGDEVLGPVLDSGKAITFSIEPYSLLLPTGGGTLPASEEAVQYAMAMVFTPEKALNLRAIPIVYQDWPDYGKKMVLQVPKGTYVMGPEQADAIIDQEPGISQKLSWWNRRGMEVIRGHTLLLPISHSGGDDVLYVEPIFLRSEQNPVSQLKKVAVVLRGKVALGDTLEDGIREVLALHENGKTAGVSARMDADVYDAPAPAAAPPRAGGEVSGVDAGESRAAAAMRRPAEAPAAATSAAQASPPESSPPESSPQAPAQAASAPVYRVAPRASAYAPPTYRGGYAPMPAYGGYPPPAYGPPSYARPFPLPGVGATNSGASSTGSAAQRGLEN
ncbi:UPF0182 family protein [uncultured Thiohalocapsa sp.]|uniref:UPF0182 family protein n=1 Tax=uncultured Thiohalocapsa sp. TaxID=768990 RepID=UPI0025DC09BE|nr:UPF0182 family protein [uncultured Thiohalocapsa sp.]